MSKRGSRGQVTLFVVVAILIIAAIIAFILFRSGAIKAPVSAEEAEKIVASQTGPVLELQEKCIQQVSLAGFNIIGMQGGYYSPAPLETIDFAGSKTILIYREGGKFVSKLPSLSGIASEFDRYMQNEGYASLDNCTKDFKQFKNTLDDIQQDKTARKLTAKVEANQVIITTDWPLTLSRGEASTQIKPGQITILIPLGNIWTVANDIANMEVRGIEFSGEAYDNYLFANSEKTKNIAIEIRNPSASNTLFLISSVPSRKGELPYRFYFGIKR